MAARQKKSKPSSRRRAAVPAQRASKPSGPAKLSTALAGKRIAVIHDWLNGMRGGEAVLEAILEMLPKENVQLFTLVCEPEKISDFINSFPIHTSFIQKLPLGRRKYRSYLQLFPAAIESFDLRQFDVVLSTSHCVAKGVITPADVPHISYVHSPMRYVWDLYYDYFPQKQTGFLKSLYIGRAAVKLRQWDSASASRPTAYVANSGFIAQRIEKYFGRSARVIYPPCGRQVELEQALAQGKETPTGDFYLLVTAFAPYKRTDLAVEAFVENGLPLVIVGGGQDNKRLRKLARGASNIRFTGNLPRAQVSRFMAQAKAFVYPGIEDFGIAMVEAQAYATPIIAYGRGGVLETVIPNKTGLFFHEQTKASLNDAVAQLEARLSSFNGPAVFKKNVMRFSHEQFQADYSSFVLEHIHDWGRQR